jgi:hypothetical protein
LPLSVKVTLILSRSVGQHSWVGNGFLILLQPMSESDKSWHPGTSLFTKANLTRSGFVMPHFQLPSLDVTHAHDLQKESCTPPTISTYLVAGASIETITSGLLKGSRLVGRIEVSKAELKLWPPSSCRGNMCSLVRAVWVSPSVIIQVCL